MRVRGEKAAREELGLAGREGRLRVGGRSAREPLGPIAPGDQLLGHDAQRVSGGEDAQHEVVVLRPAARAVAAELDEHAAPQREGRMREWALDEGIALHFLRARE